MRILSSLLMRRGFYMRAYAFCSVMRVSRVIEAHDTIEYRKDALVYEIVSLFADVSYIMCLIWFIQGTRDNHEWHRLICGMKTNKIVTYFVTEYIGELLRFPL